MNHKYPIKTQIFLALLYIRGSGSLNTKYLLCYSNIIFSFLMTHIVEKLARVNVYTLHDTHIYSKLGHYKYKQKSDKNSKEWGNINSRLIYLRLATVIYEAGKGSSTISYGQFRKVFLIKTRIDISLYSFLCMHLHHSLFKETRNLMTTIGHNLGLN